MLFSIALTLAAAAFFTALTAAIRRADDRRRADRSTVCYVRTVRPHGRISRRRVTSPTGTFHEVEPLKPFAMPAAAVLAEDRRAADRLAYCVAVLAGTGARVLS
jgi:hypothetical protein